MLDRIESTVHQLHTITDSLAHDLRSPLTAIRGKLEMSLPAVTDEAVAEPIVAAIDELDRLSDFLNKSLDVAEARADALRLSREEVNLTELLPVMVDLYEPSMAEHGLEIQLRCSGQVRVLADAALLHRVIANLLDNELKHLGPGLKVAVSLHAENGLAVLAIEDNGAGFEPGMLARLFEARVKGRNSSGHGLGLTFVHAVARAHGGTVSAANRGAGGAAIIVSLPLAPDALAGVQGSVVSAVG
jgi:signal transduction histidine kinase